MGSLETPVSRGWTAHKYAICSLLELLAVSIPKFWIDVRASMPGSIGSPVRTVAQDLDLQQWTY